MVVFSDIHTKHINTVCGLNVELLNVKLVVHIVTSGLEALSSSSPSKPEQKHMYHCGAVYLDGVQSVSTDRSASVFKVELQPRCCGGVFLRNVKFCETEQVFLSKRRCLYLEYRGVCSSRTYPLTRPHDAMTQQPATYILRQRECLAICSTIATTSPVMVFV